MRAFTPASTSAYKKKEHRVLYLFSYNIDICKHSTTPGAITRMRACACVRHNNVPRDSIINYAYAWCVLGIFVIVTRCAGVSTRTHAHACKMDVVLAERGEEGANSHTDNTIKNPTAAAAADKRRERDDTATTSHAYSGHILGECIPVLHACVCVCESVSLYGGLFIYYAYVGVWCLPCEVLEFEMNIFDRMCTDGEPLTPLHTNVGHLGTRTHARATPLSAFHCRLSPIAPSSFPVRRARAIALKSQRAISPSIMHGDTAECNICVEIRLWLPVAETIAVNKSLNRITV